MKKTNLAFLILFIVLLCPLLSCGCTTQPTGSETITPTQTPMTTTVSTTVATPVPTVPINPPQVRIISPGDVAIVGPDKFTVTVGVENFRLVDNLGTPNAPGEGHIHYFLDVEAPTTPGVPAISATGRYTATANSSYTWTEVPGGFHIVAVELVNNDHTPLVPPVTDTITVLVGREGAGGSGGGGGGGY